jgi:hypothetical protein
MKMGTINVMATSHLFTAGIVGASAMHDFSFLSFIRGKRDQHLAGPIPG